MPLIHGKSKKSFEKNVKTEMEANPGEKHRAQNLAIAYSVKRKAAKKMANGGMVSGAEDDLEPHMSPIGESYPGVDKSEYDADSFDDGSEIHSGATGRSSRGMPSNEIEDSEYEPESMADAIRGRRAARMARGGMAMADGGEVDLEANSEESPNMEDRYSFAANGKEQYDLDQAAYSRDDNETGDSREKASEDEDDHSMIASIMSKMKAKRR